MLSLVPRATASISRVSLSKQFSSGQSAFAPFRFGAIFIHSTNQRRQLQLRTDQKTDLSFHDSFAGYASRKMSQAKISSFFSRKKDSTGSPAKETAAATKNCLIEAEAKVEDGSDGDSPVKTVKSKRRTQILDDSSEDEPSPSKMSPNENKAPLKEEKTTNSQTLNSNLKKTSGKKTGVKRRLSTGGKSDEETPLSKRVSTIADSDGDDGTDEPKGSRTRKSSPKVKREAKVSISPKKNVDSSDDSRDDMKEATSKGTQNQLKKMVTLGTSAASMKELKHDGYRPDNDKYDPVNDAPWKKGEKIPYLAFCQTLERIDENSSRLKMIEILRNFFRSCLALTPNDLIFGVYLCLNKTAPDYEGQELGIGDSLLMKAIAEVTGRTLDAIKKEVHIKGDLGMVAESSKTNQKMICAPPKLLLSNVFAKLKQITQLSGHSVQSKKVDMIKSMFVACRGSESKFLIRSLTGKLRIGLAESSLLTALAHAITLHSQPKLATSLGTDSTKKILEEATLALKTVYCECPNYDKIIEVLLIDGFEALPEKCRITPGIPMKPMLAHPTKGVHDVLKRFENMSFTCEFKYDGERAQIHMMKGGKISIFSRNQENNTAKYPDIIQRITKNIKEGVTDFIMDSEAVAYDRDKKQILPFQTLMHRKKKDVEHGDITIQVYVFAFDLLYLNGKSLVREPFRERRRLLREHFNEVEAEFGFAANADLENVEDIQEYLEESIKGNCEGLMVKTLDKEATYEIAKRSHNWLKLKKDYLEGVGDTIDVVVIGGWKGKGKRTGTYGGFLLACYDPDSEEFQSLCKIGTGFKEEELEQHSNFFKNHVLEKPKAYYNVDSSLQPDDWFDAVQVWEIKCADLSISPLHKAAIGLVDPEKGISLRFPRFVRIREDKNPEDATHADQIASMYRSQDQIKNAGASVTIDEEDYY